MDSGVEGVEDVVHEGTHVTAVGAVQVDCPVGDPVLVDSPVKETSSQDTGLLTDDVVLVRDHDESITDTTSSNTLPQLNGELWSL